MRVLFDHCVPRPLRKRLLADEIRTCVEEGWDDLDNGRLLAAAERRFDVFLTSDQNLVYQQNLATRRIAIVVLPTNHLPTLLGLVSQIQQALGEATPGAFLCVARPQGLWPQVAQ